MKWEEHPPTREERSPDRARDGDDKQEGIHRAACTRALVLKVVSPLTREGAIGGCRQRVVVGWKGRKEGGCVCKAAGGMLFAKTIQWPGLGKRVHFSM